MERRTREGINRDLESAAKSGRWRDEPGRDALAFRALSAIYQATGECRLDEPFADLRPVLTKEGLVFECTHEGKAHRSKPLVGLA
jgi:hypothetical protein